MGEHINWKMRLLKHLISFESQCPHCIPTSNASELPFSHASCDNVSLERECLSFRLIVRRFRLFHGSMLAQRLFVEVEFVRRL